MAPERRRGCTCAQACRRYSANPYRGWWGQRDQFSMGPDYDPVERLDRFVAGTPAVLGIACSRCRDRTVAGGGYPGCLGQGSTTCLSPCPAGERNCSCPLGAKVASPSAEGRRGGHLAVSPPDVRWGRRTPPSSTAVWSSLTSGNPTYCVSPRSPFTPASSKFGTRLSA